MLKGQNVVVEHRAYESDERRLAAAARELVELKLDVIFGAGPPAAKALASATRNIPLIVVDLETDPIEARFAASLAQPGGNVTGVFLDQPTVMGKWFEFLRAINPRLSRVAAIWDPITGRAQLHAAEGAARALSIRLQIFDVSNPEDVDRQLLAIARARVEALVQLSAPLIYFQAKRIADFALKSQLPAISLFKVFPESGGLMSYGPDLAELYKQCGTYVGRVLKGDKASQLPIARPNRIYFVVNRRAERAIGITVPPMIKMLADEVID